jgi:hypothetical protein
LNKENNACHVEKTEVVLQYGVGRIAKSEESFVRLMIFDCREQCLTIERKSLTFKDVFRIEDGELELRKVVSDHLTHLHIESDCEENELEEVWNQKHSWGIPICDESSDVERKACIHSDLRRDGEEGCNRGSARVVRFQSMRRVALFANLIFCIIDFNGHTAFYRVLVEDQSL